MKAKISKTAFADYNNKKKQLLDEIEKNKEALATELKAAVPKNLAKWLNEDGNLIIKKLVQFGTTYRDYQEFNDQRKKYGFISVKEFASRLRTLRKAWNNTVKITLEWGKHLGKTELRIFFMAK